MRATRTRPNIGALGRYDGWLDPQNRLIAGFSAEHDIESRNDIETPDHDFAEPV